MKWPWTKEPTRDQEQRKARDEEQERRDAQKRLANVRADLEALRVEGSTRGMGA